MSLIESKSCYDQWKDWEEKANKNKDMQAACKVIAAMAEAHEQIFGAAPDQILVRMDINWENGKPVRRLSLYKGRYA